MESAAFTDVQVFGRHRGWRLPQPGLSVPPCSGLRSNHQIPREDWTAIGCSDEADFPAVAQTVAVCLASSPKTPVPHWGLSLNAALIFLVSYRFEATVSGGDKAVVSLLVPRCYPYTAQTVAFERGVGNSRRVRLSRSKSKETQDDLYLIAFSVHIENWTCRYWNDGSQC